MHNFFAQNMDIVFFVYGMAFFAMGMAIFLQPKKESGFRIADILWLLAAFGFTHGANEFLDMWAIIKGREIFLDTLRLWTLVVSYFFLFEFGRRLLHIVMSAYTPNYKKLPKFLPWWLSLIAGFFIIAGIVLARDDWKCGVTIGRYLLGFPGCMMIGSGFLLYYRSNRLMLDKLKTRQYFLGAAFSFYAYAFFGGLIVPKGRFFPENWVNTDSFFAIVSLPVQLFRAACAIIAAWSVCGTLRIFSGEKEEKLQKEVIEHRRAGMISDGLRAVVNISDDLISCADADTLFKMAVEFVREKLGIERCAIFLDDGGYMAGTYGTDRHGMTTDEHAQRFPKDENWDKRCKLMGPADRQWFVVDEPYLEWNGQYVTEIGKGWIVVTPIQSAHRPIGVFVNDAAISGAQLDPVKQDILAVFSSLLGNIAERNRSEKEKEVLNKDLMRLNKRFERLAIKDSHTGLYNHRYLMEIIEAEFDRAARANAALSVLMLDLDYFKSINDVYGHQFGDLVLKQLARQLKKLVRRYDIVIRYGGEEFMIVSPGIDRVGAIALGRRILEAVNLYDFGNNEHNVKLKLTISAASYPDDKADKGMELIGMVDMILNRAKEDGGNRVYSSQDLKKVKPAEQQGDFAVSEVKVLKDKIGKLTKRANQSLIEAVFAFAKTVDLKDHDTAAHAERTVHYAVEIGQALGLPKEELEQVRQACILHDLGKIGISEHILIKNVQLTAGEYDEIKKHPQIGVDIIRPLHFLHNIIPFILYHHEKWDGTGYPKGLKGEKIPLGARIVAIADVYQALTAQRPYRKAYSKEEAVEIIKKASGTQFDPKIVELFLKTLEKE